MSEAQTVAPQSELNFQSKSGDECRIHVVGHRAGAITVVIKHADEGVVVDLYACGQVEGDALASTWLTFDETVDEDA